MYRLRYAVWWSGDNGYHQYALQQDLLHDCGVYDKIGNKVVRGLSRNGACQYRTNRFNLPVFSTFVNHITYRVMSLVPALSNEQRVRTCINIPLTIK